MMKTLRFSALLLAILAAAGRAALVLPVDDPRIQALGDKEEKARLEASGKLIEVGPPAVPALAALLEQNRDPSFRMAHETLLRMASEGANTPRQSAIAQALAAELDGKHGNETKYILCYFLGIVGDKDSVAALDRALDAPEAKLRERARWALARIPGHQAVDALIARLDKADPPWRVALINALGEQANPRAGAVLQAQLAESNKEIQQAALAALAKIPDAELLTTFRRALNSNKAGATDAALEYAETLIGAQQNFAALAALVAVSMQPDLTVTQICRLLHGLGRAGSKPAMDLILGALPEKNLQIRGAAIQACAMITGQQELDMLAMQMRKMDKPLRLDLLEQLGLYGRPAVLRILMDAAKDTDVDVRAAALRAMEHQKNPLAFDALLAALGGAAGADSAAAEMAMIRLDSDEITAKILAAYKSAGAEQKPALLRILSYRRHADIPTLFMAELKSGDPQIRAAAATGIGRLRSMVDQMPLPQVRDLLIGTARQGPAEVAKGALESLLCVAMRAKSKHAEAAGKMFVEILKLTGDEQQRAAALLGIYETADPKDADLLALVEPYVFKGEARKEAAQAAAKLAMNLPASQKERAVKLLKAAVELRAANAVEAIDKLDKMGIDFDPMHDEQGFVTVWWITGPFPNRDNVMWKKSYFPEEKVHLAAKTKVNGKSYSWKRFRTVDSQGLVDLHKAVGPNAKVGAYAYAEITVEREQEVLLKMGSDDSIIAWVNGTQVHAQDASRGVKVDEDQAQALLKAGVNKLLVKVLDKGGDWGFVVRLCTPDGKPLKFKQKME